MTQYQDLSFSSKDALYQLFSASFCVLVLVSNIISAKMVMLPFLSDIVIPAGLITYPLTFLLNNLVSEFYGPQKARLMVYNALFINILGFCIIQFALMLPASEETQNSFHDVLGLSGLRIFSSLSAYLIAQLVDIRLFASLKKLTGEKALWLRNNGATCFSQLIDTIIIDTLYLGIGLKMGFHEILPIVLVSYSYKFCISILNTPFFYISVSLMKFSFRSSLKSASF